MQAPRLSVLASLAVLAVMTATCVGAEPTSKQLANDPAAELILQKARQAIVAAPRLKIACDWSTVENNFKIESRAHQTIYLDKSIGYLAESRLVPVAGKSSRARTQEGRRYRLLSSAMSTRQLYRDRSVAFFDPLHKETYQIEKDPGFVKAWEPAAVARVFVPPGLRWATEWEEARSRYRVEKGQSTPTTVAIILSLRDAKFLPGTGDGQKDANRRLLANFIRDNALSDGQVVSVGVDRNEPEHHNQSERHEIVLDRRSLLPVSWREVNGDLDSLATYTHFDLNPTPEHLTAFPPKPGPQEPLEIHYNHSFDWPDEAWDLQDLEDDLVVFQPVFCVLRLFHLF
jgi:hypothetical protein